MAVPQERYRRVAGQPALAAAGVVCEARSGRTGAGAGHRSTSARPRILVVDDEPSIRDLLAKTLALAEYDVDVAADGRSALDRMRHEPYDLLIADLKMPGIDGLSVIREAKRYRANLS